MNRPARSRAGRLDGLGTLAGLLAWLIVIGLPIAVGLSVRARRPEWPAIVPLVCGLAALGLCVLLAEPVWRGARSLVAARAARRLGRAAKAPEERAADLLILALTRAETRFSQVSERWPSSPSPLIAEAYALLLECASPARDAFDQAKLNRNLQRLNDVVNRLRGQG